MFNSLKDWHAGLSKITKFFLWAGSAVFAGSAVRVAAGIGNIYESPSVAPVSSTAVVEQVEVHTPNIVKITVTEAATIPFTKLSIKDGNLESGKTEVRSAGVNGVKNLTYEVTTTDGKQTSKNLVKEEVTTKPIAEVTAVGTYVKSKPIASSCDSNYDGVCVPVASDVDCEGGRGNGPAYVSGPVYVVGSDIYGLDRDGNGVGCE